MTEFREPTTKDANDFLKNAGRRGANTLSVLGKMQPFITAWNSPIGVQIIKDDVERLDELLQKVWSESASAQELAEFRVLKSRLEKITQKIADYIHKVNEVTKK